MSKRLRTLFIVMVVLIILPLLLYFVGKMSFYLYADICAKKLITLDSKGLLSTRFGAAWQEVVYGESYQSLIHGKSFNKDVIVQGIQVKEYPSISVVEKLNRINYYSNKIQIEDRNGREIAAIRTDHQRVPYAAFPKTLVESVVASEDQNFFENNHGFEFDSFLRAAVVSLFESLHTKKKPMPRGTSTITQQVGKMFISQLDSDGNRFVMRTVDRKLRELKIAAALRKKYSPQEIMEIYLNHCLTSSYGLIGAEEITRGLWGKSVQNLNDAESVYLARMVKWGTNVPDRIKHQCAVDMDRIGKRMNWSKSYQKSVLEQIKRLTFQKPNSIVTGQSHLVDLANICWLTFLEKQGYSESRRRELNLLDPSSLIRKKGDVTIRLTIDLPLQEYITDQVNKRGYADSLMVTDIRIGSSADTIKGVIPKIRREEWKMRVLTKNERFSDPSSAFVTSLKRGDTIYTTTEYDRKNVSTGFYRAVYRYYRRDSIRTEQQYAYGVIDAKSGELRAYVSRDHLGSGCAGLFEHSLANGSSTLAPLLGALAFDLEVFSPSGRWDDRMPVSDSVPWQRALSISRDSGEVAVFADGKRVMNSDSLFHGDTFIWEHLRDENRIFMAELLLRLNRQIYGVDGSITPDGEKIHALFKRMGIDVRMKKSNAGKVITGVQIIKELSRLVGGSADTLNNGVRPVPIRDDRYSTLTGDMELTLLQQMHLYNAMYEGVIFDHPKDQLALFLKNVTIQGDTFNIQKLYPVKKVKLLENTQSLRPIQLGLFELMNRPTYEIPVSIMQDTTDSILKQKIPEIQPQRFWSIGVSDPHRPYYYDRMVETGKVRWGILNSVITLDLGKVAGDSLEEKSVLTFAAVGEWRKGMIPTAGTNGKQLHVFLIDSLLKNFGVIGRYPTSVVDSTTTGYFASYKNILDSLWKRDSLAMYSPVDTTLVVHPIPLQ